MFALFDTFKGLISENKLNILKEKILQNISGGEGGGGRNF